MHCHTASSLSFASRSPVVNVESYLLERPVEGMLFDDVIDVLKVGIVVDVLGSDGHLGQRLVICTGSGFELLRRSKSVDQSRLTTDAVVVLSVDSLID